MRGSLLVRLRRRKRGRHAVGEAGSGYVLRSGYAQGRAFETGSRFRDPEGHSAGGWAGKDSRFASALRRVRTPT